MNYGIGHYSTLFHAPLYIVLLCIYCQGCRSERPRFVVAKSDAIFAYSCFVQLLCSSTLYTLLPDRVVYNNAHSNMHILPCSNMSQLLFVYIRQTWTEALGGEHITVARLVYCLVVSCCCANIVSSFAEPQRVKTHLGAYSWQLWTYTFVTFLPCIITTDSGSSLWCVCVCSLFFQKWWGGGQHET